MLSMNNRHLPPSLGLLTSNQSGCSQAIKETGGYEFGTSVSLPYVEAPVMKFRALV